LGVTRKDVANWHTSPYSASPHNLYAAGTGDEDRARDGVTKKDALDCEQNAEVWSVAGAKASPASFREVRIRSMIFSMRGALESSSSSAILGRKPR
jgi:hypothetical protein